jgi:hypothetical protein
MEPPWSAAIEGCSVVAIAAVPSYSHPSEIKLEGAT